MTTYYVWRRNSDRRHLDGYVGWSAYQPLNDQICTYTIIHETTNPEEGRHLLLTVRVGDNVPEHKRLNCAICWTADPSLI